MDILLTVDVEDWFQVENLRRWVPFSTWDSRELRVEANVHKLLDLFEDIDLEGRNSPAPHHDSTDSTIAPPSALQPPGAKKVKCTFFVLGWLAERLPHLVREIASRGHEVASHGYSHQMCNRLSAPNLRSELAGSKHLLEDITGAEVTGFRAPNFSVDDRVLSILQESGYGYDSSYNDFSIHGRYGKIRLNGQRKAGVAYKLIDGFFELPVSNLSLFSFPYHLPLPWSGGAYFRLMPFPIFTAGVRSILKKEDAYIFYVHPWEVDPGQPKVEKASRGSRFKHYRNIPRTEAKLKMLIESFIHCRFVACCNYIEEIDHKT
jgi:polysaccharide deacetylase family protein (PEP-CTERM system associated)